MSAGCRNCKLSFVDYPKWFEPSVLKPCSAEGSVSKAGVVDVLNHFWEDFIKKVEKHWFFIKNLLNLQFEKSAE